MKNSLSIVVTIIILVLFVVIFPLYNYFEREDDMSYNIVLKATTNMVEEVINNGYIDQESVDKFYAQLAQTGNGYDVVFEAHKRLLIKNPDGGDSFVEKFIIDYNDDIFTKTDSTAVNSTVLKSGSYLLEKGDRVYIKVKNSNTTMAGAIFNIIIPTSSKDRIVVNYGGIVKNAAWKAVT